MSGAGHASADTQAVLLLTAPLAAKRRDDAPEPLQPREYRGLARFLAAHGKTPADLLAADAEDMLRSEELPVDADRARALLARGLLLSRALEQWGSRAIWALSSADDAYPARLRRLGERRPAILYGCGDPELLDGGGLAVVGSRNADKRTLDYARAAGERAASLDATLVSGGARGIDQAAMRGALEAGGRAVGALSSDLQRAALRREHREPIIDGALTLASPYDPAAGFNVGNAMQRNKLIYALADAALIVSSDYEQGGTWAGAVEQLDKMRLAPVYVRSGKGAAFEALIRKGAQVWPDPATPEELERAFSPEAGRQESPQQMRLLG